MARPEESRDRTEDDVRPGDEAQGEPERTHLHSWLFMFANNQHNLANLPSWFAQWWSYFSFTKDIL